MGMFSVIDGLTDMPMTEALDELPLDGSVKEVLSDGTGRLKGIHDTMLSYEKGQWDEFSASATTAGIPKDRATIAA